MARDISRKTQAVRRYIRTDLGDKGIPCAGITPLERRGYEWEILVGMGRPGEIGRSDAVHRDPMDFIVTVVIGRGAVVAAVVAAILWCGAVRLDLQHETIAPTLV